MKKNTTIICCIFIFFLSFINVSCSSQKNSFAIANEYFSNEAELTIDTCFVLSQGNARIAVIVNGEISCDIPVGESTTTIAVPADTSVVIRLAGESAGFDLSIELN